jgi:hypothetical protein
MSLEESSQLRILIQGKGTTEVSGVQELLQTRKLAASQEFEVAGAVPVEVAVGLHQVGQVE